MITEIVYRLLVYDSMKLCWDNSYPRAGPGQAKKVHKQMTVYGKDARVVYSSSRRSLRSQSQRVVRMLGAVRGLVPLEEGVYGAGGAGGRAHGLHAARARPQHARAARPARAPAHTHTHTVPHTHRCPALFTCSALVRRFETSDFRVY